VTGTKIFPMKNKKPYSSILHPTPKDQECAVIARFSATACL